MGKVTHKLSILTPVLASDALIALLPLTIRSVAQQQLPGGWSYEWIVVEDGDAPVLADFPWPPEVTYRATHRQVGAAAARTVALTLATGDHIIALDADDELPAAALSRVCRAFDAFPSAEWVAGQESTPRHRTPWVSRKDPRDTISAGLCPPNTLYPFWKRTGQYPVTFQCAYKTSTIRRHGGYPAMPYGEDINLLFAVSSYAPGVVLHDIILLYRRWSGQTTAQPAYFELEDISYQHIEQWANQLSKGVYEHRN